MLVMIGPWTGWIERCLQQSGLPHLLQAIELEPPTVRLLMVSTTTTVRLCVCGAVRLIALRLSFVTATYTLLSSSRIQLA